MIDGSAGVAHMFHALATSNREDGSERASRNGTPEAQGKAPGTIWRSAVGGAIDATGEPNKAANTRGTGKKAARSAHTGRGTRRLCAGSHTPSPPASGTRLGGRRKSRTAKCVPNGALRYFDRGPSEGHLERVNRGGKRGNTELPACRSLLSPSYCGASTRSTTHPVATTTTVTTTAMAERSGSPTVR